MIPIATRIQGVEEYYFAKKLREIRALQISGKPVINMGIGSPDLPPPTEVIIALKNSLLDASVHKYQPYIGLPEFREAVSSFYQKQFSVAVDAASEIIPLMGSKEGIMHISMAFLNEGDGVLIPNPGYPTYTSVTNLVRAKAIYYDLDDTHNWQPDFEKLEKLDLSNVKIMWVNYPHMPTGAKAQKETFEKAITFGKKHNIVIVNDNPYSFILNDNPLSILQINGAKDIAIELNSLSKSFNMAGWRVGMLLTNATFIKEILKVKTQMDSGMFYGIQQGAIAALNLSDDWFKSVNKIYQKRRELVWQLAEKLNCTFDKNTAGMFVWAKLPKGKTTDFAVDELLYQKDIFITPGHVFGSNGEGYIRFSLCVDEKLIKEAVDRI